MSDVQFYLLEFDANKPEAAKIAAGTAQSGFVHMRAAIQMLTLS